MNNNMGRPSLNEAIRTSIDQMSEEVIGEMPISPSKQYLNLKTEQSKKENDRIAMNTMESFGINME